MAGRSGRIAQADSPGRPNADARGDRALLRERGAPALRIPSVHPCRRGALVLERGEPGAPGRGGAVVPAGRSGRHHQGQGGRSGVASASPPTRRDGGQSHNTVRETNRDSQVGQHQSRQQARRVHTGRNALKKYADQLADLYHNAPCSYYSLDPDGVFTQINDAGLKWLGRTREEVVGKMRLTDLLTPASGKTFLESYQRLKECGWLRDLQLELAREDGTSLSVLLNATAIKDAAGRFVMSCSIMFDITDCKFAEQVP